eukprot:81689-Rhodomonas_salina.1
MRESGRKAKTDAAVFYAFLMILQYPHLRMYCQDVMGEGLRISGFVRFDGPAGFREIDGPEQIAYALQAG